jgi:hypothetical protein
MSGDPGAVTVEFASNPNCLPRPLLAGVDGPASKVRQRAATRKRQWREGASHAATQSVGYAIGWFERLFAASPGVAPAHTPWMLEHQKELTSKSMRAAVDLHKTRIRTQVATYRRHIASAKAHRAHHLLLQLGMAYVAGGATSRAKDRRGKRASIHAHSYRSAGMAESSYSKAALERGALWRLRNRFRV